MLGSIVSVVVYSDPVGMVDYGQEHQNRDQRPIIFGDESLAMEAIDKGTGSQKHMVMHM